MCAALLLIIELNGGGKDSIPTSTVLTVMGVATIWYSCFLVLFVVHVPEPQECTPPLGVCESFLRVKQTLANPEMTQIRRYLIAVLLISEGSGTGVSRHAHTSLTHSLAVLSRSDSLLPYSLTRCVVNLAAITFLSACCASELTACCASVLTACCASVLTACCDSVPHGHNLRHLSLQHISHDSIRCDTRKPVTRSPNVSTLGRSS